MVNVSVSRRFDEVRAEIETSDWPDGDVMVVSKTGKYLMLSKDQLAGDTAAVGRAVKKFAREGERAND